MLAKLVNGSPIRIALSLLFVLIVVLNAVMSLGMDFKDLGLIAATISAAIGGETVKPTELPEL